MKLKRLIAKNVFKYDEIFVDFDNQTYLVTAHVQGNYDKSNGVGKSAIMELIVYCLFQKTLRGLSDISKYHSGKYHIELEFDNYKIVRTQSKLDIYVDGEKVERKKSDAQSYINEIVKFDMDMLRYTNVFTPENNFFKLSDTDKKDVLMKIINVDWIDDVYENVKEESDNLKGKKLDTMIEIYEKDILRLPEAENKSKELEVVVAEMSKNEQGMKDYLNFKKELSNVYEAYKKVWLSNNNLKVEIKRQMEEDKKLVFDMDLETVRNEITDIKIKISDRQKVIADKNKVNGLLEKGVGNCPYCNSMLTKEYVSMELTKNNEYITLANNDIKEYNNMMATLTRKLNEGLSLKERRDKLTIDLNANKNIYTRNKQDITDKRNAMKELAMKNRHTLQYKHINISLQDIKVKQMEHAEAVALAKALVQKQTQLEQYKVENIKINKRLQDLEVIKKLFGKDGLKQYAIGKIMGYLENEINEMLMSIFPGMQIKFYTNLNVDKRNMLKIKVIRQGNEVDFSEFSAGERRIFEVIFQVCLTKLFEQFSNTNINIFWFDEVLDPLDMSNSNLVVDLIKLIGEEDKTVFVISHKEHIQQLFDNKLVIESDGVNSWIGDNKKGKEKMV